jgi:phage gp45-like
MRLDSYYFGIISKVLSPQDKDNASKYQYEYEVIITVDDYAQMPVRCIREDKYGTRDDFEDVVLEAGSKAMVMFPRGDRSLGVIMHSTRSYVVPQDPGLGRHWRNRFNKIVRYIDKNGNYSVTSDQGPNLHVKTNAIVLDDSVGEQIILDKDKKTIFINCKDFTIDVKGNVSMAVAQNSTVSIKGNSSLKVEGNATVDVTGDCSVTAKNLNASIKQSAKVKCKELEATATGNAKIKAAKITLNGESSGITTANGHQNVVDFITGVPVIPSKTVFGDV